MSIGKTPKEIVSFINTEKVQVVDLRFMDFPGLWQHFSIPAYVLDEEVFEKGLGFDGSSIRGWQAINESDMLVKPVADTAFVDPFLTAKTLVVICNICDPLTGEDYTRDPRNISRKAEAFLKGTGLADVPYFGPECEFFIFDDIRYDQNEHEGYYHIDSAEGRWNTGRQENPNLGYTVVADADSGNVWTFNDARKMVCCLKWDRFEHNFSNLLDLGGENMARMKWSPAKEKKGPVILGLETETYEAKGDRFTFKGSGGRGGFISGGGKTENIDFTVYTARKIVTNSKLLKVLCQMETIPIMGGVPLRQTSYYPNRNPKILRVRFDTSAARKISDDKKLWAIPKYKTVVTVTEVASQTDKAFIKDLLGE